jgi:N-acetylneuraminic acid mutarotase
MFFQSVSRTFLILLVFSLLLTGFAPTPAAHARLTALTGHTATQLLDARILVVGGAGAAVRFYALGARQGEEGPRLAEARRFHTATLLRTGEVLVVGGIGDNTGALATVERYDPLTNQWRIAAPLNFPRQRHTATLLGATVLVAGGEDAAGVALNTVERYDPVQDRWQVVSPLSLARSGHTASLLPDGRIIVIGGRSQTSILSSIELFDATTQGWTTASFGLQTSRFDHTATLRHDGRIVVAGGSNRFVQPLASVELVDPMHGVSTGPSLAIARSGHSATLRPDGALLVAGGTGMESLDAVEAWLPASTAWVALAPLTSARSGHTATVLPGGAVLLVGGNATGDEAERIPAPAGGWQTQASLSTPRHSHTTTLLPDGAVLATGGIAATAVLSSTERYDPIANSWQPSGALRQARFGHTATLLEDGTLLVTGGSGGSFRAALNTTERFDPTTGDWRPAPAMQTARRGHTATLLADGAVLVVGGETAPARLGAGRRAAHEPASTAAERFDPTTGQWSAVAALLAPRVDHTATLLADGRVLVVGGNGAGLIAATAAEIYDPATGQWRATETMHTLRVGHTATLLPDGRVLVAGGFDPTDESYTVLASAEIFEPATNTWRGAAPMLAPRLHHVAVLLPAGEVLAISGENRDGLLSSAELYDPGQDRWRTLPRRDEGAIYHAATLLLDGRVLVTGGLALPATLDSVIAYTSPTALSAPVLAGATLNPQQQVVLSGAGFSPAITASSGATRQSATNAPLVQLRHLDSARLVWPGQAAGTMFSSTMFTTTTLASAPALLTGPVIATLFVNGVASQARVVVEATAARPEAETLYLPVIVR